MRVNPYASSQPSEYENLTRKIEKMEEEINQKLIYSGRGSAKDMQEQQAVTVGYQNTVQAKLDLDELEHISMTSEK